MTELRLDNLFLIRPFRSEPLPEEVSSKTEQVPEDKAIDFRDSQYKLDREIGNDLRRQLPLIKIKAWTGYEVLQGVFLRGLMGIS